MEAALNKRQHVGSNSAAPQSGIAAEMRVGGSRGGPVMSTSDPAVPARVSVLVGVFSKRGSGSSLAEPVVEQPVVV